MEPSQRDALERTLRERHGEDVVIYDAAGRDALDLFMEFQLSQDLNQGKSAVDLQRLSVEASPEDVLFPKRLDLLSLFLSTLYTVSKEIQYLEESIQILQLALGLTPTNDPSWPNSISVLGTLLGFRFKATGRVEDLEEAIRIGRQVIELPPENDTILAERLNNLASYLGKRYELEGNIQDLEEAILFGHKSIESTPSHDPGQFTRLANLGALLTHRYEVTGKVSDLNEAVGIGQQVIDSTPTYDPERSARLNNLGTQLSRRYELTGNMQDLERAIEFGRQAVRSPRYEENIAMAQRWNNLGNHLARRYERKAEPQDLKDAIEAANQAVAFTPEGHPEKASKLDSLGSHLLQRYKQTGLIQDLNDALKASQEAVDSASQSPMDQSMYLNNLGEKLCQKYQRNGHIEDLNNAITNTKEALRLLPESHINRNLFLHNLGFMLSYHYEYTKDIQDLHDAIHFTREAGVLLSDHHLHSAPNLNNLGSLFSRRGEQTRNIQDLDDAVLTLECALKLTPKNQSNWATLSNNLGHALSRRHKLTNKGDDLKLAGIHSYNAWRSVVVSPIERLEIARDCMQLLFRNGDFEKAYEVAHAVYVQLPTIDIRFLSRNDQQFVTSQLSGVTAVVCAVMLQKKETNLALEILERGRAVILSQLIANRHDINDLKHKDSDLLHNYENLHKEINTPIPPSDQETLRHELLSRRQAAIKELYLVIEKIRCFPGNERFLLGLEASQMQNLVPDGSKVVFVNITPIRSDAFIVSCTGLEVVNFDAELAKEAEIWVHTKWPTDIVKFADSNKRYKVFLKWLWNRCVKNIMDRAGFPVQKPESPLPRIFWIGSDFASVFPFHAAGVHNPGSIENVWCRAMSSYAPSFMTFSHAKKLSRRNDNDDSLVSITMATTSGLSDLPGAIEEVDKISKALNGQVPTTNLSQPNTNQVIEHIQQCSIAHFACHGITDIFDPSNSAVILQKTDPSGLLVQDPLTAQRISELNLLKARIAYLSSCSTAKIESNRLADESIHIVSAFQVAGFPHVVGCLWPSFDDICVQVAERFYGNLYSREAKSKTDLEIATAFHKAMVSIINKPRSPPLKWACFVHYGP